MIDTWNEFTSSLILAFVIGLVAYVYAVILTDPEHIFHALWKCLEARLPWWLFKPIIGCELCVAGELALWTLIFKLFKAYWLLHQATGLSFSEMLPSGFSGWLSAIIQLSFLKGIFIIMASIYSTIIYKKIHSWAKK